MKYLLALLIGFIGCKPSMPVKSDYEALPCYLADKCLTLNVYSDKNKTDCALALQKCFKYSDWDKCKNEKDPADCRDRISVKL